MNPLRQNTFVRADRVLKLRQILEEIASVTGLTNEEKDPEEFLNILLAQVMKAEPFLKVRIGKGIFSFNFLFNLSSHWKISYLTRDAKYSLIFISRLYRVHNKSYLNRFLC